jgi:hypothetical protein
MRRDVVKATFDDGFVRARRRVRIPPDIPVPREIVEREVTKRLDAERTAMFADHVRSMFEKARMLVARSRLEVIHSPEALLLGDSAVLSVQHDGGVGFIPFADAATHVLPVGRHHLVALAPSDRALELPTKWAHDLNERQVVNARRHVFFSPDDDLEPLVWKMLQRR